MEQRSGAASDTGLDEVVQRRLFLKRAAVVGWSTPLIWSLFTIGAQAQTCSSAGSRPVGCACTTNTQCLNLNCCTSGANIGKCGYLANGGPDPCVAAQCCSGTCKANGRSCA